MKKNVMMRIASFLLIAVLVSTSAISGTYAKYVTQAEGSDTARVAKWGVKIAVNGTAFAETYDKDDATATITGASVISTDGDVVAPGTKGEMTGITLSGKPEVAFELKYEATLELDNWVITYTDPGTGNPESRFYCPLEFKIGDVTVYGRSYTEKDALVNAVQNLINDYTAQYEAGTDLTDTTVKVPTVSWAWAFEDGADADAKLLTDVMDTALGDDAADDNASRVTLTVKCTATQID